MIGPPPSFYDPNQAIVPEGLSYDQWVMEHYPGSGQYAYAQGAISGNVQYPPQSQLHQVPAPPAPQNQYNFVQEYGAEQQGQDFSYDTHHTTAADRPQRGLPGSRIPRRGGAHVSSGSYPSAPQLRVPGAPSAAFQQSQQSPSHPQQGFGLQQSPSSSYYYQEVVPQPAEQPQPHSSYNFVNVDYQAAQFSSNPSYTPASDLTSLPSVPSSVSTPSVGGTDDGQTPTYPLASQHPPHHQAPSRPSGSAPRGRGGRVSKVAKRARVDDSFDGDSDTQSDDDRPMHDGFRTVSVPPPQGQSSLPARL